jgi:small subunit ribosomal protein S16
VELATGKLEPGIWSMQKALVRAANPLVRPTELQSRKRLSKPGRIRYDNQARFDLLFALRTISSVGHAQVQFLPHLKDAEAQEPGTHPGFYFERNYPVLMIRLARVGARKQPHYRVVVIEKDRARNGRSVEVVGTYNPRTNPASVDLKRERIDYWTAKGAQLSETVGKLLKKYQPATDVVAEAEVPAVA